MVLKIVQFFYENLSTISWVAPTGLGLTYSVFLLRRRQTKRWWY